MNQYIYGHFRGSPAREHRKTGAREVFRVTNERTYEGDWSTLGMGYCDEFRPWTEELSPDHWERLHR